MPSAQEGPPTKAGHSGTFWEACSSPFDCHCDQAIRISPPPPTLLRLSLLSCLPPPPSHLGPPCCSPGDASLIWLPVALTSAFSLSRLQFLLPRACVLFPLLPPRCRPVLPARSPVLGPAAFPFPSGSARPFTLSCAPLSLPSFTPPASAASCASHAQTGRLTPDVGWWLER